MNKEYLLLNDLNECESLYTVVYNEFQMKVISNQVSRNVQDGS